jgi:hypothetical protein
MTDAYHILAAHTAFRPPDCPKCQRVSKSVKGGVTGQKYTENIGEIPRVSRVSKVSTGIEIQTSISTALAALEYRQPDLISLEECA